MRDAALLPGRKEGKRASRVEHQCTLTNPMVELILPVFFSGPLSHLPFSLTNTSAVTCIAVKAINLTAALAIAHKYTHTLSLSLSLLPSFSSFPLPLIRLQCTIALLSRPVLLLLFVCSNPSDQMLHCSMCQGKKKGRRGKKLLSLSPSL